MKPAAPLCGSVSSRNVIGVLSEKMLHSVIKRFIEPNEVLQEVKVCGYYDDIKNDAGIFEVQTRSFNRLRAKLTSYLETERVTVVYSILLLSDLYGLTRRRAI